jgi:hypothetical protein
MQYLKPLSRYLDSNCLASTIVERRDAYSLLISYEESKYICNYFWKSFVEITNTSLEKCSEQQENLEDTLSHIDFANCIQFVEILDEAIKFGAIASFMVEADM